MANKVKAIKDLAAAGHTRKDIRVIMSITSADVTEVLGKDNRGRKKAVAEVEVKVVVKAKKESPLKEMAKTLRRGPGRPKGSKNK
tara:strand:+ start:70 stop:324 length:255 start_codon:yes stop_codon:yes gene_type:complete